MNLYLRLLFALVRSLRGAALQRGDGFERHFRVWPTDLDINGHMNNGRYLTVLDLVLIEYFVRTGFARAMLRAGWRPMSGGSFIVYRKSLKPWQRYRIRMTHAGADEFWNYMQFSFLSEEGIVMATGYLKGAAVGRGGIVSNRESWARIDWPFPDAPLPLPVRRWLEAEQGAMQSATQGI